MKKISSEVVSYFKGDNSSSEAVVHYMIEKIISLSISKVYNQNIERRIPDKCWDYIRGMIDHYIQLEFLAIDRDDLHMNKPGDKNILNNYINSVPGAKLSGINSSPMNFIDRENKFRPSEDNFIKNELNVGNQIHTGNTAGFHSLDSLDEQSDSNNLNDKTGSLTLDNNLGGSPEGPKNIKSLDRKSVV